MDKKKKSVKKRVKSAKPRTLKLNPAKLKPKRRLTLRTERDIAFDFAEKVYKKFDKIIKAAILFGSQSKKTASADSDIDIILIIDDAAINWDIELVAWYREELGKIIAAQKYSRDLHINTIRLTTWWEDLLHGDPVVINILRYGEALLDYAGFFNPIKALLLSGKIRSTPEAVHAALRRAPAHLYRSKQAEMGAIEGAYWAMIDSAQAALMTAGKIPPSPEHIPEMLHQAFVEEKMLKSSYVKGMKELISLHKKIVHGRLNDIKGAEIDEWQDFAEKFLNEMTRIIGFLLNKKE